MTEAPRIERLDQLAELCRSDTDRELWQCLAEGAALEIRGTLANVWSTPWENALQALRWTREEFYGSYSCNKANEYPTASEREDASDAADQQIIEEINLYLTHLFGRNELDEPPKFEPLPNQQPLPFGDDDMPTKQKQKPAPATMTDDELLAWSLGYDSIAAIGRSEGMRNLQENGATNQELLEEIQIEWSSVNSGSPRPYCVQGDHNVWGTAIWFDHDHPHGAPRLFYRHKPTGIKGAVEVEGSLLREVRRVLGIEDTETNGTRRETFSPESESDAEFKTLKSKGKSRPKHPALTSSTTPTGIAELDPDAEPRAETTSPVELIISPEIVRRPLEWFRKSPFDTRTSRPKEWLDELAASLKRDGQLQPCLARPDGEHIAGWTRVEAARLAGLTELDVRIVTCDDITARRLILLENAKRRDLTEREKTEAYNALAADYAARGLTQRQLAEDLGLSESALSNNLRLRSIPDAIWKRYEAGGLSTDQLRAVAVHGNRPKFVEAFLTYLEKGCYCDPDEQPENRHFESAFEKGIEATFRPMTRDSFGAGCQFKPTPEQKAQLEIVKVKRRWGGEVNMAANVTLWNKLNKEAKAKAKAKQTAKQDPATQKAAAKAEAVQRAARRRDLIEESWSVARGQAIGERFAKPRKQDHAAALRLRLWISQTEPYRWSIELDVLTGDEAGFIAEVCADVHKYFTGMSFAYQQPAIEDLCKWLNVDPVPHWKPTRQLLNHCTPDELQELAEEFDLPPGTTANDLPDVMLDKWPGGYIPPLFVLEKPDEKPAKKGRK